MCTDALKLPSMLAHTTRPAAPDSSRTPTASWPFVSPLSLQPLWVSAPCSHVPSPRPSLVEPAGQGCGRWSPPPSRLSPHGRCEPQAGGRGQCCCREPRGSCLFREGDQLRSGPLTSRLGLWPQTPPPAASDSSSDPTGGTGRIQQSCLASKQNLSSFLKHPCDQ